MVQINKTLMLSLFLILQSLFIFISCSGNMNRLNGNKGYDSETAEYEPPSMILKEDVLSKVRSDISERAISPEGDININIQLDKNNDTEEPTKRKQIYSGNADLLVEDLQETKQIIEAYAGQVGGYVESMQESSIVIRVPADSFDVAFNWILDRGTVRYQSIETADITDFYNDLFSRLEISKISRERLYELLKRTTDTTEQVQILKEIGRLTEEIESTKLLLKSLDNFIAYSRISITLESRLNLDYISKEEIPFFWIRNLSPLYSSSSRLETRVTLEPGEDFAVFDKEKIYRAENWDGAQIRISTVENDPVGDGEFWKKALLFHLDDFYDTAVEMTIPFGETSVYGVLWTSRDRDPFQYFTGVSVDKKNLQLIEIFSPVSDAELFERIFESLEKGELN